MAKFKQVSQSYLFKAVVRHFRNMVRNYDGFCRDDDFFSVININFDHDKAVELIELAYSAEELEEMKNARGRRDRLDLTDPLDDIFLSLWNNSKNRNKCRAVLEGACEYLLADCKGRTGERTERRFNELKKTLKLTDLESEITLFSYVVQNTCFCWPCRVENREKPLYYAMALDRSYSEVSNALSAKSKLIKLEVLDTDFDFHRGNFGDYIDGSNDEAIQRRFYSKCDLADALPWEFYGNLSETDGEVISKMISASDGKCNILLYGVPGTGKTSFARSLARQLGRAAFDIKQGDDDGKNMRVESRMVGIRICNDQEDPNESLMIIDESDELLRSCGGLLSLLGFGGGKSTEKSVTNALLDEMKVPAIWISNTAPEMMDESVRRRFDYSVCFERMNTAQRVSIWRNIIKKYELDSLIPEEKIESLATEYVTSAGGIAIVLENVKRLNPSADKVDELIAKLMKPHCKLMGIKDNDKFLPAKGYSLDGLNVKGKVSPAKIVKAVRNYLDISYNTASEDKPRMNILLFGPPGTGKTEFVKYLGKELDRRVVVMKGSDIISKWVGQSEKNIASAFRQAEAEKAILFFDEIDGLLQDRNNAAHNWEVTQVNEFLQQMENFNGVMVAATNFSKNLDPATMRRFTFKLEFDYLDDAGKKSFFEKMFKTTLTDEELAELKEVPNLAPGDFRTVRQEQFYLGDEVTNLDRIAALKEESLHKKDVSSVSSIGF